MCLCVCVCVCACMHLLSPLFTIASLILSLIKLEYSILPMSVHVHTSIVNVEYILSTIYMYNRVNYTTVNGQLFEMYGEARFMVRNLL